MRLKSRAKLGRRGSEGRGRDRDDGKAWAGGKGRERGNGDPREPGWVNGARQPELELVLSTVKVDEGSSLKIK